MQSSLAIKHFRGLDNVKLDGLSHVNVISGKNNVGKTALLEAVFLYSGAYNPALAMTLNANRGLGQVRVEFGSTARDTPWDSLFHHFDSQQTIEIIGIDEARDSRSLRLSVVRDHVEMSGLRKSVRETYEASADVPWASVSVKVLKLEVQHGKRTSQKYFLILDARGMRSEPTPPTAPYQGYFLGSRTAWDSAGDADRYGRLLRRGDDTAVLDVLKIVEPKLKALSVIVEGGVPMLHGDVGMPNVHFVPLPILGEGFTRLASIAIYIASARGGALMVDEIENGLHHSILLPVWKAIGKLSRELGVQVFATTHSFECIAAAHGASLAADGYGFSLYRLEHQPGGVQAVTYDKDSLEASLKMGLEIR